MNRKTYIHHLFSRLLKNTISEQELMELLEGLDQPESEWELKELMEEHWEEVKDRRIIEESDRRTSKRFSDIMGKVVLKETQPIQGNRITSLPRKKYLTWLGVAASLLILVSVGSYWVFNAPTDTVILPVREVATTQYTGKQVVNLPDGSTVILNEGSQLSFTSTFGHEKREIYFSGEGYFDISHDPAHPFVVHTGEVTTTVLGTAFNLMAYEDQPQISVTVERGEVAVGDDDEVYDKILPKEQLVVDKQTRKYEKEVADLTKILAWKDKFLILTETTIAKAAEEIGARYHVQVNIGNEDLRNCTINAAFMQGESLDQVLRVICGVLQADYTIIDNKVEINGGRKCE